MLFKFIVGITCAPGNNYVPYREDRYLLYKEQDFSTTVFLRESPIEYIDIPNKEDVIHMCAEKYFNSFKITLSPEITDRVKPELSVSRERFMKDILSDETSIFFIIDPRDPSNIEKFEKYLGLRENELTAEILKNNVE